MCAYRRVGAMYVLCGLVYVYVLYVWLHAAGVGGPARDGGVGGNGSVAEVTSIMSVEAETTELWHSECHIRNGIL